MDCILTYKGDGVGNHGHPKYDRVGPVREFLVDNQLFYTFVKQHLQTCTKCDPTAILEYYLNRRFDPKFWQTKKNPHRKVPPFPVSESLVKLALKYYKLFPNRVKFDIVKKFLLYADFNDFVDMIECFTEDELLNRAIINLGASSPGKMLRDIQSYNSIHPRVIFFIGLLQLEPTILNNLSSVEDAKELIKVMEIMQS